MLDDYKRGGRKRVLGMRRPMLISDHPTEAGRAATRQILRIVPDHFVDVGNERLPFRSTAPAAGKVEAHRETGLA